MISPQVEAAFGKVWAKRARKEGHQKARWSAQPQKQLSGHSVRILEVLRTEGPLRSGELARKAGVPKGSICGSISRLVVLGHVEKTGSKAHPRYVLVKK